MSIFEQKQSKDITRAIQFINYQIESYPDDRQRKQMEDIIRYMHESFKEQKYVYYQSLSQSTNKLGKMIVRQLPMFSAILNCLKFQKSQKMLVQKYCSNVYSQFIRQQSTISKRLLESFYNYEFSQFYYVNVAQQSLKMLYMNIFMNEMLWPLCGILPYDQARSTFTLMILIVYLSATRYVHKIDYKNISLFMLAQHQQILQRHTYLVQQLSLINLDLKFQTKLYQYGLDYKSWLDFFKFKMRDQVQITKNVSQIIKQTAQSDIKLIKTFLANDVRVIHQQFIQYKTKNQLKFENVTKITNQMNGIKTRLQSQQLQKIQKFITQYGDQKLSKYQAAVKSKTVTQQYLTVARDLQAIAAMFPLVEQFSVLKYNQQTLLFQQQKQNQFKFISILKERSISQLATKLNMANSKDIDIQKYYKDEQKKIYDSKVNMDIYKAIEYKDDIQSILFRGFMLFCIINEYTINQCQITYFVDYQSIFVNANAFTVYHFQSLSNTQSLSLFLFVKAVYEKNQSMFNPFIQKIRLPYIEQAHILLNNLKKKINTQNIPNLRILFKFYNDYSKLVWKDDETAYSFFMQFAQQKKNFFFNTFDNLAGNTKRQIVQNLQLPEYIQNINKAIVNKQVQQGHVHIQNQIQQLQHEAQQGGLKKSQKQIVNQNMDISKQKSINHFQNLISNYESSNNPYYVKESQQQDQIKPDPVDIQKRKVSNPVDIQKRKVSNIGGFMTGIISGKKKIVVSRQQQANIIHQNLKFKFQNIENKIKNLNENQFLQAERLVKFQIDNKFKKLQEIKNTQKKHQFAQNERLQQLKNKQRQLNKDLKEKQIQIDMLHKTYNSIYELYTSGSKIEQILQFMQRGGYSQERKEQVKYLFSDKKKYAQMMEAEYNKVGSQANNIKLMILPLRRQISSLQNQKFSIQLVNQNLKKMQEELNIEKKRQQYEYKQSLQQLYKISKRQGDVKRKFNDYRKDKTVVLSKRQYDRLTHAIQSYQRVFVHNMSMLIQHCQSNNKNINSSDLKKLTQIYKNNYSIKKALNDHGQKRFGEIEIQQISFFENIIKGLFGH